MSVNSYLHTKASQLNLSESEKASISTSIATLASRLDYYFNDAISNHFVFGSYDRGTILPRSNDDESDVDYMVVFADGGYQPQTYLDRLRRFVENYYSSSEITQSSPTIKLSLNHIRFELVPALPSIIYGYQIPLKSNGYSTWQATDPVSFKSRLLEINGNHDYYIKPTVRLIKYWNARNNRPFESYELERMVVEHFAPYYSQGNYWGYFSHFCKSLNIQWGYTQWKSDKIRILKSKIEAIESDIAYGLETSAENKIASLLP